jgi:hypothetical protein
MNLFQWLAIPALCLVLLWEFLRLRRGPRIWGFWLLRWLVWVTAAVAIAFPGLVQAVAVAVGIGRGTDVVLYLFVLAFLGISFYFYSRYIHLQRQVTELVRHIAIHEARRGTAECHGGES